MVTSTNRPDRPGRLLHGLLQAFNLDEVVDWLQHEAEYQTEGHNALTLGKDYPDQDPVYPDQDPAYQDADYGKTQANQVNKVDNNERESGVTTSGPPKKLKISTISTVVICLQKDYRLPEHHAPGAFTLTMLRGRINFILEPHGQNFPTELGQGQLLVLEEPRLHEVIALEDSAFLLTIVK